MQATEAKPRIVVICGPTSVGKTTVAIELAGNLGGEIVGADSMQVYRHMDIGTAKPTPAEQAAVAHHLIDVVDPDESFDAARYSTMARRAIGDILKRGRLPVVAGGTGLYIRALTGGLFDRKASDPAVRARLRTKAEKEGSETLYQRLEACDPATARSLHPNDVLRIVRALEVYEVSGKPLSTYHRRHGFGDRPYQVLTIGLEMGRDLLYERIDRRVDLMLEAGFIEEVYRLIEMGYGEGLRPMQSIGYRHVVDFIRGRIDRESLIETMKRDTRRYAKRQMTWFRADPEIVWAGVDTRADILRHIEKFLK